MSSSEDKDQLNRPGSPAGRRANAKLDELRNGVLARLAEDKDFPRFAALPRRELVRKISESASHLLTVHAHSLDLFEQRELVAQVMDDILSASPSTAQAQRTAAPSARASAAPPPPPPSSASDSIQDRVRPLLMERLDISVAARLPRDVFQSQVNEIVAEIAVEQGLRLNRREQNELVEALLDEMLGLGPLEPLLADDTVNDILVNGAKRVYVERHGKLELTDVTFRDDAQVMNVASRIVTRVGRRIDESTPLVDARLPDGSRVNIITKPLALDGTAISIRKFAKKEITLERMVEQKNISEPMAMVLSIAARCRLNILVSGGTGSGKTTLLNAISRSIDHAERIVTIEDAAELQLQQPHVVRLETRPPNLEGRGEITQRDLVKNALRMRPDRIILGEVRSGEALDMLQAMNTGHDGSMSTVHANSPREAVTRLEHMVAMSGVTLPSKAVAAQIASAIQLIAQISRMRDGIRRITQLSEIVGMEEDIITMKDLFTFEFEGEEGGRLHGTFRSSGLRPKFMPRASYFKLDKVLAEAMGCVDTTPRHA